MSQLCDKDDLVVFSPNRCMVANMNTRDVVLRGKRHKNVYKVCISSLPQNNLTCLSALNDDIMLWHKRLGHASLSLLKKVCDACVKGKQVKNSFKSKRCVSTSRPLEMLHILIYVVI